jgi:hypothetical protein
VSYLDSFIFAGVEILQAVLEYKEVNFDALQACAK